MALHTFDTAAAIKKLKEADFRENQAVAIVEIIAVSHAELATKADLELLRGDFKRLETKFEALEAKFEALETKFEALETKFEALETKFDALNKTLNARIEALEKSVQATLDALKPKIILWGIVACILTAGLSNVVNFLGLG